MGGVVCIVAQTLLQMKIYSTSFRQKSPLAGDEIIHRSLVNLDSEILHIIFLIIVPCTLRSLTLVQLGEHFFTNYFTALVNCYFAFIKDFSVMCCVYDNDMLPNRKSMQTDKC